jgi:hypothetical protein
MLFPVIKDTWNEGVLYLLSALLSAWPDWKWWFFFYVSCTVINHRDLHPLNMGDESRLMSVGKNPRTMCRWVIALKCPLFYILLNWITSWSVPTVADMFLNMIGYIYFEGTYGCFSPYICEMMSVRKLDQSFLAQPCRRVDTMFIMKVALTAMNV